MKRIRALLTLVVLAAAAATAEGAERSSRQPRRAAEGAYGLFDCSFSRPRSLERARFTGEAALSEAELCSALDPGVVVYNRVPKAGSTTMLHLINLVQRQGQRFTAAHSQRSTDHTDTRFSRFLNHLVLHSPRYGRVLWERHQAFLAGVSEKAVWINVVRDPVDRAISRFYYMRYSSNRDRRDKANVLKAHGDLSLDDCVARHPGKWRQCGVQANSMIKFFCGAGTECALPWNAAADEKQVALEQAKRNIQRRFAVVGAVERMDDTIRLLERRLPGYFGGVAQLAASSQQGAANTNSHPAPTEETLRKMREAFDVDYALYEWVRERMDRQLAACPSL